jgi:hypothetical protein
MRATDKSIDRHTQLVIGCGLLLAAGLFRRAAVLESDLPSSFFFFSFLIYQRLALRAVFFFSDIVGVWWMMVVLMVGEERVCWFLLSASLFL